MKRGVLLWQLAMVAVFSVKTNVISIIVAMPLAREAAVVPVGLCAEEDVLQKLQRFPLMVIITIGMVMVIVGVVMIVLDAGDALVDVVVAQEIVLDALEIAEAHVLEIVTAVVV